MSYPHYRQGDLATHVDHGTVRIMERAPIRGVYTVAFLDLDGIVGPAPAGELRQIYYAGDGWAGVPKELNWNPTQRATK